MNKRLLALSILAASTIQGTSLFAADVESQFSAGIAWQHAKLKNDTKDMTLGHPNPLLPDITGRFFLENIQLSSLDLVISNKCLINEVYQIDVKASLGRLIGKRKESLKANTFATPTSLTRNKNNRKGTAYSGEISFGMHVFNADKVSITPKIGFSARNYQIKKYQNYPYNADALSEEFFLAERDDAKLTSSQVGPFLGIDISLFPIEQLKVLGHVEWHLSQYNQALKGPDISERYSSKVKKTGSMWKLGITGEYDINDSISATLGYEYICSRYRAKNTEFTHNLSKPLKSIGNKTRISLDSHSISFGLNLTY